MQSAIFSALNGLTIAACLASVVMWFRAVRDRTAHRLPLLEPTVGDRLPATKLLAAALVMYGLMLLVGGLIFGAMVNAGWIEAPKPDQEVLTAPTADSLLASTTVAIVSGLVAVGVTLSWLAAGDRRALQKVGMTSSQRDLLLGLKASVMLLPPVLVVSVVANRIVEYEHPVLNQLPAATTPVLIGAVFVSTAVVTPLWEELLFRGFIQGAFQGLAHLNRFDGPHRSDGATEVEVADDGSARRPAPRRQAYWPIVASSLLFALMHVGQGAAPIPLFVLALGLGYLYRQTGSLAAPIVVHAVLNTMTLLVAFTRPVVQ